MDILSTECARVFVGGVGIADGKLARNGDSDGSELFGTLSMYLLRDILSMFDVVSLSRISRTCRLLNRVCQDPYLWRKARLTLTERPAILLGSSNRPVETLKLNSLSVATVHALLSTPSGFCDSLTRFVVRGYPVGIKGLAQIAINARNLKHLDCTFGIYGGCEMTAAASYFAILISRLKTLHALWVHDGCGQNALLYGLIHTKTFPSLEELLSPIRLGNTFTPSTDHVGTESIATVCDALCYIMQPSTFPSLKTFGVIEVNYGTNHADLIKRMAQACPVLESLGIQKNASFLGLDLKVLMHNIKYLWGGFYSFEFCSRKYPAKRLGETPFNLYTPINHPLPHLTELHISSNVIVPAGWYEGMATLIHECPSVTSLSYCGIMTQEIAFAISQMPLLDTLDMCQEFDRDFIEIFKMSRVVLKSFTIFSWSGELAELVLQIPMFHSLQSLRIKMETWYSLGDFSKLPCIKTISSLVCDNQRTLAILKDDIPQMTNLANLYVVIDPCRIQDLCNIRMSKSIKMTVYVSPWCLEGLFSNANGKISIDRLIIDVVGDQICDLLRWIRYTESFVRHIIVTDYIDSENVNLLPYTLERISIPETSFIRMTKSKTAQTIQKLHTVCPYARLIITPNI